MDDDELTPQELEEFQATLLELESELVESLQSTQDSAKAVELDQEAFGRVSRIDAIQQQQMSKAYRERLRTRLQQVRGALSAIERGEYGYCTVCEEPITRDRLAIRPESPVCVECQSRRER